MSKVKNSNDNMENMNEIISSGTPQEDRVNSDITIGICDSSVEEYKNNQVSSKSAGVTFMEMDRISSKEIDSASSINDMDKSIVLINSPTHGKEMCEVLESSPQTLDTASHDREKDKIVTPEKDISLQCENEILQNPSTTSSQNFDCNEKRSLDIVDSSQSILQDKCVSKKSYDMSVPKKEILQENSPVYNFLSDNHKCELLGTNEEMTVTDSDSLNMNNQSEDICISNNNPETSIVNPKLDLEENMEPNKNSVIYCSTPVISESCIQGNKVGQTENLNDSNNFGEMSPLVGFCKKRRKDLKRKFSGLECIDEVEEDAPDHCDGKKFKCNEEENYNTSHSKVLSKANKSSLAHFEAPAKSILKKWQSSSFSKNSGSYFIVDECGESDGEENQEIGENASGFPPDDDFEIACKSLQEELTKEGSFNIETLKKYYSQVQLENQIDDEKFDEELEELTNELGVQPIPPPTNLSISESLDLNSNNAANSVKNCGVSEFGISTDLVKNSTCKDKLIDKISLDTNCSNESGVKLTVKVKENTTETAGVKPDEVESNISVAGQGESTNKDKNLTIIYANGEDMTIDEEDVLLEEDTSTKAKPYVFFEYVSNDPKENEDNYNPEWQKLGQLTTDEERYTAVRDRWRSLIPPDPNKDLTCRQWRVKNNKPPLNLPSRNNNHQVQNSNKRNQLCTAVFDNKIRKIRAQEEEAIDKIYKERNMAFDDLATKQDREQIRMAMRGGRVRDIDLAELRKHHIEECRRLKEQYDAEVLNVKKITAEKERILKDAREEVLLFQKFYKGFNAADDDEVCLYMTDLQVQELTETEDMLERYTEFYK